MVPFSFVTFLIKKSETEDNSLNGKAKDSFRGHVIVSIIWSSGVPIDHTDPLLNNFNTVDHKSESITITLVNFNEHRNLFGCT